jgi:dephospho-CoA kinase
MAKSNKLKVAITGNIGSGKSTFSRFISEMGYPVLYADNISKEFLANDPEVKSKVIENFGAGAFSDGDINNKYLADVVFSDPKKLNKLNSILHPLVRKKIEKLSDELLRENDIVFIEAALIYEAEIENLFNYVVLIIADKKIRMERVKSAKNLTEEEFLNRELNQISEDEKKKRADFIFSNNDTKDELKTKASLLINILQTSD